MTPIDPGEAPSEGNASPFREDRPGSHPRQVPHGRLPWADLADRVKTNHPDAVVKHDLDGIKVVLYGVVVTATTKEKGRGTEGGVMDALNAAWASSQKPKTTRGGSSSSGSRYGDDCDTDAIGEFVESAGSDDDGDDE